MNIYKKNRIWAQQGVGLIEILISLAIISIGLIGLVGLQFSVSTSNQDAYVKSQATLIIESLSDRIRINRQYQNRDDTTNPVLDATDNAYTILNNYNFRNLDACDGTEFECYCQNLPGPGAVMNCRDEGAVDAALCTPQQAAVFDAYEASCMAASIMDDMEVGVVALNPNLGAAGDPVGPNSILTVYAAWPATIWKNLDKAANEMCQDILDAQGIAGDFECVYMDLVIGDGS